MLINAYHPTKHLKLKVATKIDAYACKPISFPVETFPIGPKIMDIYKNNHRSSRKKQLKCFNRKDLVKIR